MNIKSIEKRIKEINEKYPKELCQNIATPAASDHRRELYELTCLVADNVFCELATPKTARKWGEALRKAEYWEGEAGLDHFTCFTAPKNQNNE